MKTRYQITFGDAIARVVLLHIPSVSPRCTRDMTPKEEMHAHGQAVRDVFETDNEIVAAARTASRLMLCPAHRYFASMTPSTAEFLFSMGRHRPRIHYYSRAAAGAATRIYRHQNHPDR